VCRVDLVSISERRVRSGRYQLDESDGADCSPGVDVSKVYGDEGLFVNMS